MMQQLQILNVKNNYIRSFAGTVPQPKLSRLYLAENPISRLKYYRQMCVHAFRPLRVGELFVDGTRVAR